MKPKLALLFSFANFDTDKSDILSEEESNCPNSHLFCNIQKVYIKTTKCWVQGIPEESHWSICLKSFVK